MSTKHTPGPWEWNEGTPTITKKWNGMDVCVAQVKGADLHWHEDGRMASIEAGANARLIKTAPELLTELEHVAARISARMPERFDDLTAVQVTFTAAHLTSIRAAIAKATNA